MQTRWWGRGWAVSHSQVVGHATVRVSGFMVAPSKVGRRDVKAGAQPGRVHRVKPYVLEQVVGGLEVAAHGPTTEDRAAAAKIVRALVGAFLHHRVDEIGRCIGCDRPSRLSNGICHACLTQRGRRWAEMSHMCRTNPEFALDVYSQIKTDRGRELFLRAYGAGALRANGSSIAEVRAKQSGGAWAWEAE